VWNIRPLSTYSKSVYDSILIQNPIRAKEEKRLEYNVARHGLSFIFGHKIKRERETEKEIKGKK
jgi:hypothetical protein